MAEVSSPDSLTADAARKWLRTAAFVRSYVNGQDLGPPSVPEVAFAGRSNAGKSSVLNRLCDNRRLARSSRTPGRTRQINVFTPTPACGLLVDLPGYGYARVGRDRGLEALLNHYLSVRQPPSALVLVVDIRRGIGHSDLQLMEICNSRGIPVLVLLNKADKLSSAAVRLAEQQGPGEVLSFSALRGRGLDALALWVCRHLKFSPE